MKLLTLTGVTLLIGGCAFGGNSRYADGGDGNINVNVQKVEFGQICYSQAGACQLYQPLVVGASCFCPTPYGPARGTVDR